MSALVITDLHSSHGAVRALKGLSFTAERGELVAIIGSNGAGKTTLLRTITGLKSAESGSATWLGNSLLGEKPENLVRRGVLHVADGKSVVPELTVSENLALGGIWRRDKKDVKAATSEVLTLFPRLGERLSQSADTLSGGERQMLAIARALIARPELLLLDEPSLGLAPLIIEEIFTTLNELRRRTNLTILLVEQNAMSALKIADRGVVMHLGELVATGSAQELLNDPALRAAYLGY